MSENVKRNEGDIFWDSTRGLLSAWDGIAFVEIGGGDMKMNPCGEISLGTTTTFSWRKEPEKELELEHLNRTFQHLATVAKANRGWRKLNEFSAIGNSRKSALLTEYNIEKAEAAYAQSLGIKLQMMKGDAYYVEEANRVPRKKQRDKRTPKSKG